MPIHNLNLAQNVIIDWKFAQICVQVGKSQRIKGADYAFESIHNLKEALPELWETDKVAEVNYSGVAVETSVTA